MRQSRIWREREIQMQTLHRQPTILLALSMANTLLWCTDSIHNRMYGTQRWVMTTYINYTFIFAAIAGMFVLS